MAHGTLSGNRMVQLTGTKDQLLKSLSKERGHWTQDPLWSWVWDEATRVTENAEVQPESRLELRMRVSRGKESAVVYVDYTRLEDHRREPFIEGLP